MYVKNRSACADDVLSGDWAKARVPLDDDVQESFWRGVMKAPSAPDQRVPKVVVPPIEQLLNSASVDEVRRTLDGGYENSPGVDGVTLRDLKRANPDGLVSHFNLWLLTSTPPSDFKSGVTTLISKSADSKTPGEYRPITICTWWLECTTGC